MLTPEDVNKAMANIFPPEGEKFVSMKDVVGRSFTNIQEIQRNGLVTGLKTGLPRFDHITGGMKPGNYIVVAGKGGGGKSTFALNIANKAINEGKRVVLFSLEMDEQEVMMVLWTLNADVNRNKFNQCSFSDTDYENMGEMTVPIGKFDLHIFDDPSLTPSRIERICDYLHAGKPIDLVIIDYIQIVIPEQFTRDNKEQQVGGVSGSFRALAKKLKCPLIGLSQLNEEGKVRDSQKIRHDATTLLKLGVDDEGNRLLEVNKGRWIPSGCFFIDFDGAMSKFTETGCDHALSTYLRGTEWERESPHSQEEKPFKQNPHKKHYKQTNN